MPGKETSKTASKTAKKVTDHNQIRRWAESRGGRPAEVKGTGSGQEAGILRIDFAEPDARLEEISWDEFFDKFEESRLALLVQDDEQGEQSRFSKLVRRDEG